MVTSKQTHKLLTNRLWIQYVYLTRAQVCCVSDVGICVVTSKQTHKLVLTHYNTAIKETAEEAGMNVELKGPVFTQITFVAADQPAVWHAEHWRDDSV